MNGQKLVQNDFTGEWKTEKVSKAEGIKPGLYNLYNAVNADQSKDNIGEVIHIDKKGHMMNIKYENNKTSTTEVSNKLIQKIKL